MTVVTSNTITFNLQQFALGGAQTIVTHIDGVKCIVASGPVTINSKTPATITTVGAIRHGAVKNPMRFSSPTNIRGTKHAFDSRVAAFDSSVLVTFPVTLSPGDVLVSAVSTVEGWSPGPRSGHVDSYDMIYVSAVAPNPLSIGPAAVSWSSRSGLAVPAPVNYLAKAALLPTKYLAPGYTYWTETQTERAMRFNPAYAQSIKTANGTGNVSGGIRNLPDPGYEQIFPHNWGSPNRYTGTSHANYGYNLGEKINTLAWYLMAPLDKVSLATKAKILMRFHSFAYQTQQNWDGAGISPGPDGTHNYTNQVPFALMYWLTGDTQGLIDLRSRHGANWKQIFRFTSAEIPSWFEPWGNPDDVNSMFTSTKPSTMFRRKILSINPTLKTITYLSLSQYGPGGSYGASTKQRLRGLRLTRESDGASARILTEGGDYVSGATAIETMTLDSWPTPGFQVGDVVTFNCPWTFQVGDVEWSITRGPNKYNPSPNMSYRDNQVAFSGLAALRVLGIHQADWQDVWEYNILSLRPDYPTALDNWPIRLQSGTTFMGKMWTTYSAEILAVPQTYTPPPPPPPPPPSTNTFYPDVTPVDIMAEGAALKFPEGNGSAGNQTNNLLKYKGMLYQADTGLGFPASTTAQAWFAIVRLPADKRFRNAQLGIFGSSGTGGNRIKMVYECVGYRRSLGYSNKFGGYQMGNSGTSAQPWSAEWTEDSALVVFQCDGANNWVVDWYSLETGLKNPDPTPTIAGTGSSAGNVIGSSIAVGAAVTDYPKYISNTVTGWPGEIEAVGCVRKVGGVSDADWSSIALGADIVTTLGASNIKYLKEYDPTTKSLVKPAGTNDVTSNPVPVAAGVDPVAVPASWLRPGSTIRRQSLNSYFTIDLLSEGWVYGLTAGTSSRLVPFSGKAAGYAGNVEIKVYDADTGDVVRDWTVVGSILAGAWSGSIELPKAVGWWFCEARLVNNPTIKAFRRTEFAVGYKFLMVGQSQLNIALRGGSTVTMTHPQKMSFATIGALTDMIYPRMYPIGTNVSNGMAWFSNQFRVFDATTPFMVITEAINGTGMSALYNDTSLGLRSWSDLQNKLDKWGNDVTVICHQWASNDSNQTGVVGTTNTTSFKERLDALFFGTGAQAGAHNLKAAMPNAIIMIQPTTRDTRTTAMSTARTQVVEWAHENLATVSPPVSDIRIENAGGPHQTNPGSDRINTRMAIGVARALGLDTSVNSYFTTAAFNSQKNVITVSVALPNGGSLVSPAATAIRGFEVRDGGLGTWVASGFSAVISGNTVLLIKTTGAWATNTQVRYLSNLPLRVGGDGVTEDLIMAGTLYETWDKDVIRPTGVGGMPILGALVAGKWTPSWSVTVA